ncbi:MAG TPA: type I-E CRISPR-associated protein Cas5/CasD [Urbifossiella sp.]|nr:type I-E CRISPR-associated protein Cas5/CasD [Urbifossiella sp.]
MSWRSIPHVGATSPGGSVWHSSSTTTRGVLDAILYKPQMRWHVRRIAALRPKFPTGFPAAEADQAYRLIQIRRNEVAGKISTHNVNQWIADPAKYAPYKVDADRTLRNSLVLQHVAYRIDATPVLSDRANRPRTKPEVDEDHGPDTEAKYVGMFERRVAKGQCFHHPYLGCREFACQFAPPADDDQPLTGWSMDLGLMLYDIRFGADGQNRPGFFLASLNRGVLDCDAVRVLGWDDEGGEA